MDIDTLTTLANKNHVVFRGGFAVRQADRVPEHSDGEAASTLLLFGQTGNALWPSFSQSPEYNDDEPHPMDRWSERVGNDLAETLNGQLLLPFGGPVHHPFIAWAIKAESLTPSRLGLLIHPLHGLWHAYRFAISVKGSVSGLGEPLEPRGICASCADEPCLSACPVNAFDGHSYDVQTCAAHLRSNPNGPCLMQGCMARDACPEGLPSRYEPEQRKFHMKQFMIAMQQRNQD
ncbi:MAG: hypothetical protein AB8B84_10560 [Granulosicoccus sp.]